MNVTIKIRLKNSVMLESPESIKQMVKEKIDTMIEEFPALALFIEGYTIEVE